MRRRIVVLVVAVAGMIAIAFLVPLAILIREFARDQALTDGERAAQAVMPVLSVTVEPDEVAAALDAGEEDVGAITVFLPSGETVGVAAPVDDDVELARREPASFTAEADEGVAVLMSVRAADGDIAVVRALVTDDQLSSGVYRSWLVLGLVGIGLWLVAVIVADRLGRSTVEPVRELAEAARRLGDGDLTVAVEPAGPSDVAQVGEAFNELVDRVRRLLAAERELVADLSHRLRTPLTALRLDVEAVDPPEVAARLAGDVDALDRAVDDLIEEARSTATEAMADLTGVVAERAAFWAVLAEDQERPTATRVPAGPVLVAVTTRELEALVDALLGNVFTHTEDGTAYRVTVTEEGDEVALTVEDEGPGLPEGALDRGRSGGGSTGLGLDIVARTAATGGGSMHTATPPGGGSRITVRFPVL